jgi:hypothetical protein
MSDKFFAKAHCRHCGGHIEFPCEAAGMMVPCPHCQKPTPLPAALRGKRKIWWLVMPGLLLGLIVGGWLAMNGLPHTGSAAKPSVIPNPPPADLQRVSQLAFWNFAIERKEDSTITHATARVLNESDAIRYGIEVKLELLDALGQPVGTAKDYIERLEPNQDSHIRAMVIKRDTASARVQSITEQ